MAENDSADTPRAVKPNPIAVLRRGEVYTRAGLDARFDKRRVASWIKRGLRPLDLGTEGGLFLSDDIIDLGRRKRPKPKRRSK